MRILCMAAGLLLVACAVKPKKIFRESNFEKKILYERGTTVISDAHKWAEKYPAEFYSYATLGDVYQYSSMFDSASRFYEVADSIYQKQTSSLDDYGKMVWLQDESAWRYEDMLTRQLENELALGRRDKVRRLLDDFEKNFFLKTEDGHSAKYPENQMEFGLKRLYASTCEQVDSSKNDFVKSFEELRVTNKEVQWRHNADIKTYLELYELTGQKSFLDSADLLLRARESADKLASYYRLRWLVNEGQADSVQAVLSRDSTLYAVYLRDRLRSLASGAGYYGLKPCGK